VAKPYVEIEGLRAFRRDLKRHEPILNRELQLRLRVLAQDLAGDVRSRVGASSFSYRGYASAGLKATIRSSGQKPHVAKFLEFGFHPRGSSTMVPGRNYVGEVLEQQEDRILREIDDSMDDAARKAGWH
jgi:hypothetical protein